MLLFAANVSMLFTELPFRERFRAAKEAGFRFIEFQLPYDFEAEEIAALLKENGQTLVLFNLPSGDWAGGERGIAADPARTEEFRAGVAVAARCATVLRAPFLNCLAGRMNPAFSEAEHRRTLTANLAYAADALLQHKICVTVENVNRTDVPGFYLHRTDLVFEVLDEVNRPNVRMQYDIYHAQRSEGEIVNTLRKRLDYIGHIQIADNPERGRPGTGEINYPFVFKELETLGYQGCIGLEYVPRPDTLSSLAWIKDFGYSL
ncbi:MAG: TIM barrel protein [Desulfovibrio sp.]|jgi:hydroxypyruvate isomerase|nr:TIM barrel protein [Desulfovibrio sp.]